MRNDPRFDLLVFDWDGTLMDSVASIVGCMQAAARDLGIGGVSEAQVRRTIGLGLRESMSALGFGGNEQLWDRLVERYRDRWLSEFRHQIVLFPEVPAVLSELARHGYLLAIATGKSRRGLDRDLEVSGVRHFFHASRTADEALSKPHPQMLFDIFAELGVRPQSALVIGDTTFDLEMAGSAGAAAVGVLSGSHGADELRGAHPLTCLPGVGHLPAWLASNGALP